jgi:hypothetical protein
MIMIMTNTSRWTNNNNEEFAKQVFPTLEEDKFIRKPVSNEQLLK